jgi:glycine/D-amino acid oxidase-like deaminating enzyme
MPVKAKMPSERSLLMASVPAQASVVVVGAGIVGNSLVHHLAELGWTDIVQVDKGPLPNPGGSTGHASNFIFPVDHSREIADLTLDSMRQYKELGVFTESGGFEVARTEERMEELRRRMASARAWGIESSLVTPAEVVEKVPFLDPEVILGAFWTPTVGVVDSVRAGTMMRESAEAKGALTVSPNTEVTGIDVDVGQIVAVHTTKGEIATNRVLIACGVWSPRICCHGRCRDSADSGGPPDDQRRARPAADRTSRRDLVSDRAGHGHLLLRTSARIRYGDRLLCPPADPPRPR